MRKGSGAPRRLVACAQPDLQWSLSTYTTLDCGAAAWATWWVLFAEGSPVPMSRNWRIPACVTRKCTAQARNARCARTATRISGYAAATRSATARSAAKLSLPPSQKSYTRAICGLLVSNGTLPPAGS
jgi:hypothetical protein